MFFTSVRLDWSIRRQEAVLVAGIPTVGPAYMTFHVEKRLMLGNRPVGLKWIL